MCKTVPTPDILSSHGSERGAESEAASLLRIPFLDIELPRILMAHLSVPTSERSWAQAISRAWTKSSKVGKISRFGDSSKSVIRPQDWERELTC